MAGFGGEQAATGSMPSGSRYRRKMAASRGGGPVMFHDPIQIPAFIELTLLAIVLIFVSIARARQQRQRQRNAGGAGTPGSGS
jgi:hypothetical protein